MPGNVSSGETYKNNLARFRMALFLVFKFLCTLSKIYDCPELDLCKLGYYTSFKKSLSRMCLEIIYSSEKK